MVNQAISLLLNGLFFCLVAWGLFFACDKGKLPTPAYWICGVFLIIVVLLFASGQLPLPIKVPHQ